MYKRCLNLSEIIETKSFFLLGPRMSGKKTLLRNALPDAVFLDLLDAEIFRRLSSRPETLRDLIPSSARHVIIDEIQKLPELLDEVQRMIDRNRAIRSSSDSIAATFPQSLTAPSLNAISIPMSEFICVKKFKRKG